MFSKLFGSSYAQATNEHKQRALKRTAQHQKNLDHQLTMKSKVRSLEQELEAIQRKIRRTDDPATREREVELRRRIEELSREIEGGEAKIEKEQERFEEAEKVLLSNEQMLEYVVSAKPRCQAMATMTQVQTDQSIDSIQRARPGFVQPPRKLRDVHQIGDDIAR